jgi:diketogulonate reductase-like aldo/keto reductase
METITLNNAVEIPVLGLGVFQLSATCVLAILTYGV